ncbi:MAG: response regulator [Syntrophomonadaceae bacterium]|nr:response regulator [Syntrophomonadaceae bacterium]
MRNRKPILLVEDDRIDAMSVQRALHDLKVLNQLIIRENGEEALAYLRDENHAKPAIILLDLNMPRMNGIEFLEIAKTDEELKKYPVIVLTTSDDEWEKILAFDLGVAGYMVKPVDYKQFVEVVRIIDLYWTLSELPG